MSNLSKRKKRREKSKWSKHKTNPDNFENIEKEAEKKTFSFFENIYTNHYKKIILIPLVILLLSFIIIGAKVATTGDFIEKGVSLKGGATLTIQPQDIEKISNININEIKSSISEEFPGADINTRQITSGNDLVGIAIDVDITIDQIDNLILSVEKVTGELDSEDYVVESIGSSLGESFFQEIIRVLIIAFVAMAVVVFIYFRVPTPSFYVILSAFTDIIVTLAIIDLFGVKISTAGIAAFLMLVGYSVDTDILLTIRVLKNKKGTVVDRIIDAMKTGLTMSITTLVAVTLGFFFANSDTIRQIMLILIIGLLVDIISTWLQNAPLLRWYLAKRKEQ